MSYNPIGGGFKNLPEVTKNLLIINVLMFIATLTASMSFNTDLGNILGMRLWSAEAFQPYQIVTHMFMHGSIMHIFLNMFGLWMFGSILERVWGPKRFFIFYFACGLGAALIYFITAYWQLKPEIALFDSFLENPGLDSLNALIANHQFIGFGNLSPGFAEFKSMVNTFTADPANTSILGEIVEYIASYKEAFLNSRVVVGASGAVFGLVLAYGMLFPNQKMYIIPFPFPIKALYLVIGLVAYSLFMGLSNNAGDNIAHFAHLGGMIFGFLLLKLPWFYKIR